MHKFCKIAVICLAVLLAMASLAEACTLWGAAGSSVEGGGTLIAKNRDWKPDHVQNIKVIANKGRYRFVALVAAENSFPGTKAGVNEQGFAVVSASPPPPFKNSVYFQKVSGMNTLLANAKNVDEALSMIEERRWVSGPQFLMMADGQEVAYVEFSPTREVRVRRTGNGEIWHTNHYVECDFQSLNPEKYSASKRRYDKIAELMTAKEKKTFRDIQTFAQDPVLWHGPQNSNPLGSRTIAGFYVWRPADGDTVIHVKIANPGMETYELEFTLAEALSGTVNFPQVHTPE